MNPKLVRWRISRGEKPGAVEIAMMERLTTPLVFEPGTNWEYGMSLDWVGVLVMRLNKQSLESYMEKNLWNPLGIRDITFHLELKPNVKRNLVTMTKRGDRPMRGISLEASAAKVTWTDEKLYKDPTEDEWGGAGSIASPVEVMKILHSICADDGKLLKSKTIEQMFTPQLSAGTLEGFSTGMRLSTQFGLFSSHEPETKVNHGIGGLLILSDKPTGLRSGTLSWNGLPNLLWTVDRTSGLSLFYASNCVPFGDQTSHKMQQLFEKEMYTRFLKL